MTPSRHRISECNSLRQDTPCSENCDIASFPSWWRLRHCDIASFPVGEDCDIATLHHSQLVKTATLHHCIISQLVKTATLHHCIIPSWWKLRHCIIASFPVGELFETVYDYVSVLHSTMFAYSKVQATKNRTLSKHSFDENRVFLLSSMLSGDTSEIDKITLVKVFLMQRKRTKPLNTSAPRFELRTFGFFERVCSQIYHLQLG